MTRCGYIAILGRPNVGKSTLINKILGQKLCITAHKPQTTRHAIMGIKTLDSIQSVYVDTPGIHGGAKRQLNRVLNRNASNAALDVDVVILIVQAGVWTDNDQKAFEVAKRSGSPIILAVNKVDQVKKKEDMLPYLSQLPQDKAIVEVIPISARKGTNVPQLEGIVGQLLPEQPHIFDEDELTDRSSRFLAAEMVREQLTRFLSNELPYALSVEIERFEVENPGYRIHATIWVERAGQKNIVIGKKGAMLKEIGTRARKSMESLFGERVFLELWVKVKEGWSDDARALQSLGYEE